MRTICLALACLVLSSPSAAQGAGLAYSDNFIVMAPDQPLADEVRDAAEGLRKQIALEWLGAELPPGKGRTVISVNIVEAANRGLTWLIDHPKRKMHSTWLTTSREGATGPLLAHEIVHVVLGTYFPGGLPAWANEGIASLQDGPKRDAIRDRILGSWARDASWPDIAQVLGAQTLPGSDQRAYAVAVSLTRYLLTRGDKPQFLRFAVEGKEQGWDEALRTHYRIQSVEELQASWQAWLSTRRRPAPRKSAG